MDSSQRGLQTDEKLFFKFEISSKFWQKTDNFDQKTENIHSSTN